MEGTITVEGEEVETPTPTATVSATPTFSATATATPTASASATPVATPDDHTSTPRPGHASKDAAAPSLQRARVKAAKGGARVRFWLSEPAKVSIALVRKRAKSPTVTKVVQSPAGTRAFVLRTSALKRGLYTATLTPVDAMGNTGAAVKRSLRVK
jgi:hypothetical protein